VVVPRLRAGCAREPSNACYRGPEPQQPQGSKSCQSVQRPASSAGFSAAASAQLRLWDQCGGQGGSCRDAGGCVDAPFPGKACPSGASCLKQSNWYYQCLPTEGYTCIPTNGNPPTGGSLQKTLNMWAQCGGMGGNCAGYQCMDGWYPNYACPAGWCSRTGAADNAAVGGSHTLLPSQSSVWGPPPAAAGLTRPSTTVPPQQAAKADRHLAAGRPPLPAGTSCQRQNQWYYQCLPGGGSSGTLKVWEQCGGKGGNCNSYGCVDAPFPRQSCPGGTSCQRKGECDSLCAG
jgi:hypothetical protein